MKKILLPLLLLCALAVTAQTVSTRCIGDTTRVSRRVIWPAPTKLWTIFGYNGSSNTQYLFVFNTTAVPTNGQSGKFGPFPIGPDQFYSVDFSFYGADLDAVTAGISTSSVLFTNSATNTTIQAIIR